MTRARIIRPAARRGTTDAPAADQKPWHKMFFDYGFKPGSVPEGDPPTSREYGEIFEWVTKGGWHTEAHESLILDIWLGYVDPLNYLPTPSAEVSQPDIQKARPSPNIKPSDAGKSKGRQRRFTSSDSKDVATDADLQSGMNI